MSYYRFTKKPHQSIVKFCILLLLLIQPSITRAQSLDDWFNDQFMPIANAWESIVFVAIPIGSFNIPLVLILLTLGALFFTIRFKFINLRMIPTSIQVVRGKYDELEKIEEDVKPELHELDGDLLDTIKNESIHGEVNHFQALATAVSGTVGLGNIAMVAVAISIGGPGATFWMIIAGLLGMSTKFVECTLGVKYRDISADGKVYGGPMYYLLRGCQELGYAGVGKGLSYIFALFCVGAAFGGGNAFQSNQAAAQIIQRFNLSSGGSGTILGIIMGIIVGIVILGGIKRIAKVTEKIVPIMAILYVVSALFILVYHYQYLDDAFALILNEAFSPRSTIVGGFAGVMIQGFRRAAFSNEAGAGSAAIAHSAVNTQFPASEGLVALLEPFIDTVIICTMTALVIITFNIDNAFTYGDVLNEQVLLNSSGKRIGGVNLTSLAFDSVIPGFSYVLTVAVVLFAFSTILSWSYYGLQSWTFLFGRGQKSEMIFKLLFLIFTVLGAAVTLEAVSKFSNAMILALVFPNMIGLFLLHNVVAKELKNYIHRIKGH